MEVGTDRTLAETAYEQIEHLIVTLELQPGAAFTESDLSRRLELGRTPLREALLRLSAEGLVTSIPRRGMMVAPIDFAEMLSIVETRKALDRLVVSGAARKASPEQRRAIAAADTAMELADLDPARFMGADFDLDQAIWVACGNAPAVRAVRSLHTHCRRFWYRHRNDEDLKRSREMHRAVVRAILEGDHVAAAERSDRLMDYLGLFTKHILIAD